MKSLAERTMAIKNLRQCPQGIFCTTGCTHGYAQKLIEDGFEVKELEETLELIKSKNEMGVRDAEYVSFILKLMNEMRCCPADTSPKTPE